MHRSTCCALLLSALAGAAQAQPSTARVVNAAAPAGGDGRTWATAYNDLQLALNEARAGGTIAEIWVARGAYVPSKLTSPDPYSATFSLRNNLAILGGFAGTESGSGERDPDANITTLDGRAPESIYGVYHVVTATGTDASAVLDGFTITHGHAVPGPSSETNHGGGVYADPGGPTLRRLYVTDNIAMDGAGMYIIGDPSIAACRYEDNWTFGLGAGAALYTDGSATVDDCVFTDHEVDGEVVWGAGSPGFARCTFSDNSCYDASAFQGTGSFADCTFSNNDLSPGGGAIYGTVSCVRCLFDSNSTDAGFGGAVYGSGTFADCRFVNNMSDNSGGAIYATGPLTAVRCVFEANRALGGGAVYGGDRYVSCLFDGNTGGLGGTVQAQTPMELVNCTVVGRDPSIHLPAVYGPVAATNCVLWGNGPTLGAQFMGQSLNYSTVQYWDGSLGGLGNSGDDPLFVDFAGRNFRVLAGSPCIDTGNNSALPPGLFSDLDGHARFFDAPSPDGGLGSPPLVDRGCYEAGGPVFCYANIDNSTATPIVNVLDCVRFLNLFAAGHPLANCDASTVPPALNVLDFVCFVNAFAAGCP
jgi:predicted outer membrane repeat protein